MLTRQDVDCGAADRNWAHDGNCSSSDSKYLGPDVSFEGFPVIVNGKHVANLGGEVFKTTDGLHFWSDYRTLHSNSSWNTIMK